MKKYKELTLQHGITEYAIRKMVKNGEIPFIKSGKKYLINVENLIKYINGELEAPEFEK